MGIVGFAAGGGGGFDETENPLDIGSSASASATNATAIGANASASDSDATALGSAASTNSPSGIAIGNSAQTDTTAQEPVAVGANAYAAARGAVSLGNSYASGRDSVAIGRSGNAGADDAVSIAGDSDSPYSLSIYGHVYSAANRGIAIGVRSEVSQDANRGVAIGESAIAGTIDSIAIGSGAQIPYATGTTAENGGIAIGEGATTDSNLTNPIIIGHSANISVDNAARIATQQLVFGGTRDTMPDANLNNGELTVELDETNAAFRLRGKDSGGVVREATVAW